MKKLLTLLVCCFISFGTAQAVVATYLDVGLTSPFYDAIMYATDQGLVSGYGDGTYKENNLINRAEFTKILLGARGTTEAEYGDCVSRAGGSDTIVFPDVPASEWFAKYVCVAYDLRIVEGYMDGTFRPEQTINFAEAAKIISRTLGDPLLVSEEGEPWYHAFASHLTGKLVVPTSILRFDHPITRGEMTEMMFRYVNDIRYKSSPSYEDIENGEIEMKFTCAAYHEGYVPSYANDSCELKGTSGCGSPYNYETKEDCNEAFGF